MLPSTSFLAGSSAITTACRGSTGLTLGAYVLAPALDRALALVSHEKNAKDHGLALLTTLVKDVKACSLYTKATTLTTNSASGSGGGSGGNAPTNNKGKKSQPSNGTSKDAAAAAPVDITLPTTPYTPPTPQTISALPSVDLTALGLMSALKLLFTDALHSAFPQVLSSSQTY